MFSSEASSGRFEPKVSIVVGGGNASALLHAARSALAQDYANIEVLIVGDGVEEVARQDEFAREPRLRLSPGSDATGVAALNAGVARATGDFVTVLSEADALQPRTVLAQIAALARLSPEARSRTAVISDYEFIDAGGTVSAVGGLEGFAGVPAKALISRGMIHPATVLAPRALFGEFGGLDPARPATCFHELLARACAAFDVLRVEERLVRSRRHALQAFADAGAAEADRLWRELRNGQPAQEASAGPNDYAFWMGMLERLRSMRAPQVAAEANRQAEAALDRERVSVIIPFGSGYVELAAAIRSALDQTHRNTEVIVVHDRPDPRVATVVPAAEAGGRVRTFCQNRRGVGEARNFGLGKASGSYVAFLDSDDLFRPGKIRRQLAAMLLSGAQFSHTSYYAKCLDGTLPSDVYQTGLFSGRVFPRIMSYCPIALPTVMARTAFLRDGHMFPEAARGCEDFLLWIRIARDTEIFGLDEPLSTIHVSTRSTAYDPAQQKASLERVCELLEADPRFAGHWSELHHLRSLIDGCREQLKARVRPIWA